MNHKCTFCGHETEEILDFGDVALAGGFLKPEQFADEKKYPLKLCFCPRCYSVQLADKVSAETLFREYFYFSSQIGAVKEHFGKYAKEVIERFDHSRVLEIGCNDGYLLSLFADTGARCVGVDPAGNVVNTIEDDRLNIINAFFTEEVAQRVVRDHGKQKMVLANNVFAHIPNIHETTKAIAQVLDEDGVLIIEVHDLGAMIEGLQYDWIYHEHLYYYSALSLTRFLPHYGLEIFDAEDIPSHGGSKRYFIRTMKNGAKRNSHHASDKLVRLYVDEYRRELNKAETFHEFARKVKEHREALWLKIKELKENGYSVCGYGASGRANTILQWTGLDSSYLDFIIDDAPAKVGYCTPGTHIPIISREEARKRNFTHCLILAWPYASHIIPKIDGYKILPLPQILDLPFDSGWREMDGIGQWKI